MAYQEIPSSNGVKNISIPRSNAYIKIAEKNGSRLLPGRSILSIANSIPSIFQIFSSPLFKVENFVLGSAHNRGRTIHNDNQESKIAHKTDPARKWRTEKRGANKTAIFFVKWARGKREANGKLCKLRGDEICD